VQSTDIYLLSQQRENERTMAAMQLKIMTNLKFDVQDFGNFATIVLSFIQHALSI
jgi:hypothetical protein